jgi:uncharacterized protein YbjT (DUF2867 family)
MILVTGASGTNGRAIVSHLRSQGAPVRALVRDPGKAGSLSGLGAELAQGDFADAASLTRACRGCDTALLLAPVDQQMLHYELAFIDAARSAGVGRIVDYSALGANPDSGGFFTRVHGRAEEAVKASGLSWTLLRPTFFMQNLLGAAASIKNESRYYDPYRGLPVTMVDVRDIAAVAARVLTEAGHSGKTYAITGPEALTGTQIAEAFSRVLEKPIVCSPVPREAFKQILLKAGLPEWRAQGVVDLDEVVVGGPASFPTDTVAAIARRQPIALERFIRDHVGVFR